MDYERGLEALYLWVNDKSMGSFDSALFDLLDIANSQNILRLGEAFPYHTRAFLDWVNEGKTDSIFLRHGIEF